MGIHKEQEDSAQNTVAAKRAEELLPTIVERLKTDEN